MLYRAIGLLNADVCALATKHSCGLLDAPVRLFEEIVRHIALERPG